MTHEQYSIRLKATEPNIIMIGKYQGSLYPIKVKCTLCGHEWVVKRAYALIRKKASKCPKCHSKIFDINNSELLSNKYPRIAKWLYNDEDGYKYTCGQRVKVDWICPDCGNVVKNIPVNKVVSRRHVPCRRCSDGVSYPNKLMYNLLESLGESFMVEYQPEWIKPKRFDFFIPNKKIIIEMDGAIGHGHKTFDGSSVEYGISIDKYKETEAKKRGIDVIRIDAYVSDISFISNNILKSKLNDIYDLSSINWEYLDEISLSSLNKKVAELWNQYHDMMILESQTKLSRITLTRYLARSSKLGLCDYDAHKQKVMSGKRNIVKAYSKNRISVKCLETGEIFESYHAANEWLGYAKHSHVIRDYLQGNLQSAGKHPITKVPLHWEYVNNRKVG